VSDDGKYIAMDENGEWWSYVHKPTTDYEGYPGYPGEWRCHNDYSHDMSEIDLLIETNPLLLKRGKTWRDTLRKLKR